MAELATVIRYLNEALFVVLAIAAAWQWWRRRDAASGWVAATFGVLGGIVLLAAFMPRNQPEAWPPGTIRLVIIALFAFPYLLYRFAALFEPPDRRIDGLAAVLTGAIAVATLLVPAFPQPGEPRPPLYLAYVGLFLVQWSVLSLFVAWRLWRGGRGKPTVARRRMRLLSLASLALNIGIVVSGIAPGSGEPSGTSIVTSLLSTTSAMLFGIAFAPPGIVRMSWRRPEERALQMAQLKLMGATTVPEITDAMLGPVVDVLGAAGAAMLDHERRVVAMVRRGDEEPDAADGAPLVEVPLEHGVLQIWAGSHTPYFGQEELDLLGGFGVVVDLAWARCLLLEREREATAQLAESESRLQEAQQLAHIGAWEWDPHTGTVVWSDEMFRIYGLPDRELPSYSDGFMERIHPEDREILRAATLRTAETGEPFRLDHRIVRPDGTVRVVHAQGRLTNAADDGSPRLLGTIQDVTDRKRAEEALAAAYEGERAARLAFERANGELEAFVYSVSHDLKSPIISLLGYLDYLKLDFGEQLPPDAAHYIERMSASASYMEALIQDLLELSRIGRSQTEPEAVDLAVLIPDVATELSVSHPEADVVAGPMPVLYVNPVRMRQLFTNLLANAMEHGGRPDVTVTIAARDLPGGGVEVAVSDDGRGIPPEYREKVFGVFERIAVSDSPDRGTGIGLAICRKIMESTGGHISVGDAAAGTRLVLDFPATTVRRPVGVGTEVTA